jgi:hypothetical protein
MARRTSETIATITMTSRMSASPLDLMRLPAGLTDGLMAPSEKGGMLREQRRQHQGEAEAYRSHRKRLLAHLHHLARPG